MADAGGKIPSEKPSLVERRGGVQLWRQIADRIRQAISLGEFGDTGMMPPEMALAAQFSVNRHTVRAALKVLAQEGVVQSMQGKGTVILRRDRLTYPIGRRTRFSDGLAGQAERLEFRLLASRTAAVGRDIAEALGLAAGSECHVLETLGLADGVPLSRATHVFAPGLSDMAEKFARTGSITKALQQSGIPDYVRLSTDIMARHALADETAELALSPGSILLETVAVNGLADRTPFQYSLTRFPADRIKLGMRIETA